MISFDSWIRFALTEIYAMILAVFIFRRSMKEAKNSWRKAMLLMLAAYFAFLFYGLLSPVYFFRRFAFSTERLNLIPFRALRDWLAHPLNLFGNILLFMPLGFFEVLLHPGRSRKWQLGYTAATALLLSLLIEFAQLFNYRVSDVDDIILNTIGATTGALLCILQQNAGFDQTRVGRIILPRIPRVWNRHSLVNRFCVILVVTMETVLFTVNYFVTIPKLKVRENDAPHTWIFLTTAAEQTGGTETVTIPQTLSAESDLNEQAEGDATASEEQAAGNTTAPDEQTEENVTAPEEPTETAESVPDGDTEPLYTPRTYYTENLALEAENVLLVRIAKDGSNAQVIYAVHSTDPIYPASTLKMLTALTVLDIADPDETVTLGTEVYIPPLDASRASLEYGMTFTIRELLEGLLLPSGADAAYALGVYCGRKLEGNDRMPYEGAVRSFVAAMNRKAKAIGAVHTTAENVVGLDANGQLTTTEDLIRIAKVFLDSPVLAEICHMPKAKITSAEGKTISLKNTNKMLLSGSEYYNGDIAGVKTGTTNRAGNCLVSLFTIDGERYLCVVMNSSYYGKFTDTQKLYDMCAAAYQP